MAKYIPQLFEKIVGIVEHTLQLLNILQLVRRQVGGAFINFIKLNFIYIHYYFFKLIFLMTTNKLLKISSDYNFRILFSYLDYNYIIKVIKYNKFLQNKVNIKIEAKCNYIIEEKIIDRENLQKIYDFNKNSMDISFFFFFFFFFI